MKGSYWTFAYISIVLITVTACIDTSIGDADKQEFIRYYGLGLNDEGRQVIVRPDGGAIVLAEIIVPDKGKDIAVFIVDAYGNLTQPVKIYGGPYEDIPYRLVENPTGGYYILASTQRVRAGSKDISIYSIDNNGDSLWSCVYGSSKNDEGYDMIISSDGNLVVTGYTAYDRLSTSEKLDEVLIAKFSTSGDSIFFKNYGNASFAERGHFIRERQNGFLVAATTDFVTSGQLSVDRKVFMLFADAYGQGKFHSVIDTIPASAHLAYFDILKDVSDTLQYILAGDIIADADLQEIFITSQEYRIDNSFPVFATQWMKTFDFTGKDVCQGVYKYNQQLYLFGSSNQQALLFAVDNNGTQIFKTTFGSDSKLVINDACILDNNTVLATGSKTTGDIKVLTLQKRRIK